MEPTYDGPERRSSHSPYNGPFERHLQTGIQAVLVGLVLWVGSSILAIREDVAVLRERSAQQGLKIDNLTAEAKALTDSRRQLIEQYEGRIKGIEHRVETLEGKRLSPR